jgi:hypothetical protein
MKLTIRRMTLTMFLVVDLDQKSSACQPRVSFRFELTDNPGFPLLWLSLMDESLA